MSTTAMNTAAMNTPPIVPRSDLDFGLDNTIPRFWFDNNPFRTRLMDGLQLSFPDGERYFISSVRYFRERVKDPVLAQEIKDFTRQEGQHGMAHTTFNNVLKKQGMPVDELLAVQKTILDGYTRRWSPDFNVALTAAFEHMTSLMAEAFFGRKMVMAGADPHMQALFAWHAIEEMEHKSVVFNVMKSVTSIGYFRRCAAMIIAVRKSNKLLFKHSDHLLKADGFSWLARKWMVLKNLNWMYGPKGVFSSYNMKILAYFRPGFHPTDIPVMQSYPIWLAEYQRSGNPHKACQALLAHAA
ncbi:metal-dependent hydrolase [Paraburkholderia acidicola]|uniref:Metal-dependent hydrolase n=1 Tax=Paraburkholderia acidicola TaxID=1912599 RepID=A0ABV1LXL6_9BURK